MEWLGLLVSPLAAPGGVWLGKRLDHEARTEERNIAEQAALTDQASDVLGQAKLTVDAIHPAAFGLFGPTQLGSEVDKRRAEADGVRPALSILAVRWPQARDELSIISAFLGTAPVGLERLEFVEGEQKKQYIADIEKSKAAAVSSLNSVIDLLHAKAS